MTLRRIKKWCGLRECIQVNAQVCSDDTTGFKKRHHFPKLPEMKPVSDPVNFTQDGYNDTIAEEFADVAQLVEQLIRNQQVVSSSLTVGSILRKNPVTICAPDPVLR